VVAQPPASKANKYKAMTLVVIFLMCQHHDVENILSTEAANLPTRKVSLGIISISNPLTIGFNFKKETEWNTATEKSDIPNHLSQELLLKWSVTLANSWSDG
jgi:hypothetical protein